MHEDQTEVNNDTEGSRLTKAERKEQRRQEKHEERERQLRSRQRMRAARWGIVALGIVAVVGGTMFVVNGTQQPGTDTSGTVTVAESDWSKGPADAPAVLVEYGDFQCPACRAYQPVVKEISEELAGSLRVVFRQFPLRQSHPNAQVAAQAAEAAGRQGRFWEMHDILFERQSEWSGQRDPAELFTRYGEELGLNRDQFIADLNDPAIAQSVEDDVQTGIAARVNATPTFYLNGEKLEGYSNYEQFKDRIREAARGPS